MRLSTAITTTQSILPDGALPPSLPGNGTILNLTQLSGLRSKLVSFLRRHILKVKYISLVNLIAGREVVAELVADGMTAENVKQQLEAILPGQMAREQMLQNYDALIKILGQEGASERAAGKIVELLSQKYNRSLQ